MRRKCNVIFPFLTSEQELFVYAAKLPDEVITRKIGTDPNITDANGHLIKISVSIELLLRFGG